MPSKNWNGTVRQRSFYLSIGSRLKKAGEPHFLEVLAVALGDVERYVDLRKQEAQAISAKPDSGNVSTKS